MKKSVKITLWIVGVLVFLTIGTFLSADIIASHFAKKEVRKAFANIPQADATVGDIYLNLLSGSAIVKDITFATNSLAIEDTISGQRAPGLAVHIPTLSVWNIHYLDLLRDHKLIIHRISIDKPQLLVYLDEKHPETILPAFPKDTTIHKAGGWLSSVDVRHIELKKMQARLHSTFSPLKVAIDSLSTECRDIRYDLRDSLFSYNDSVYELKLGALAVQLPDGLMDMEFHQLKTEDQGPIKLGYSRIQHVVKPAQLANMRREPTTWIDLELNELTTSPLNPIRKALAQDYTLDELKVDVKRLHVYRDARHPAKNPYGTPQDFLRKLPVHFKIKHIDALARKIDVDFASTDINRGEMHLKNARAQLANVTNRSGATWKNHAKAPFGEQGTVDAQYDIHFDKAASFDIAIHAKDAETSDLNPFIRPLIGITSDCHIDQLDAAYKGDRTRAAGTFCMQYHGLNVKVHKEDKIPYEVVTKNADFFTSLANTLVPKSNPSTVDIHPRQYDVEWNRDEWKPYPMYLFGPCIDGIKKTMLPGLYVHKQTKK